MGSYPETQRLSQVTITTHRQNLVTPSPIFYGMVLATVFLGTALARGYRYDGVTLFLFVVTGWAVSLALHEFGHAIVAYKGGDRSVADKGYLTLDVRKYGDIKTSLLFPIFILIIGGIGLPGGAVWINVGAIRSPVMRSLMSAAGPAASGLCALLCLLPVRLDLVQSEGLVIGLSFLGWIQIIAMIFNLLPIPGLDGFGIIEPHLSRQTLQSIQPLRQYGMIIIFIAIFFLPPARDAFFGFTDSIVELVGGSEVFSARARGWFEFRFWERR
ncbi:MAG: Zn-dependent protease [Acidimicrobiales bacterium]